MSGVAKTGLCPYCKSKNINFDNNKNVYTCLDCDKMFYPDKLIVEVNTALNAKDGQHKCPACGSSDITYNIKKGKLVCNYCATEFAFESVGFVNDVKTLTGDVRGSGTTDINVDASNMVTLKCGGCGAEIVIDTSEANASRCHWCRSVLSVDSKVDNGSVPDVILPFKTTKEEAQKEISTFVGKRKFFAHPQFKKEFNSSNIMGVYFPYMLVDANCHASLSGKGEHLVRRYTVGSGDDRETYYDADLYSVDRDFDIAIDDLTVESSSDKLNKNASDKTNNIINSIMPFDTQNCVKYTGNYLIGYTSEKRDVNVEDLETKVVDQINTVTRYAINEECKFYDRGINWTKQDIKIKGRQWVAAYLPVWLYSYMEVKGDKKILHYVCVNARTNETMGSVPINMGRLFFISFIIEIIGIVLGTMGLMAVDDDGEFFFLFYAIGFIFYFFMYARYRNQDARHTFELETRTEVTNVVKKDEFIEHRKKLKNSRMNGANDTVIKE